MRLTLRRSCASCAKSKHSCDLRTPRCSRCIKRRAECVYANEPLTAPEPDVQPSSDALIATSSYRFSSLDPFDSYPQTRLSRDHVRRLIHSFLNKIAFQYYPLDLNASTNPFLVSWWPLALGDPALFHVSLQTACLDEELLARKGFHSSEILMADSVALLRRKVEDPSLAVQDGTMNSVITLATIEYGKGDIRLARMHVEGVKKLVNLRGGINAVRQTSPLTARMISWASLLITGQPQFVTQDDTGTGDGIPPIPEWQAVDPGIAAQVLQADIPELQSSITSIDPPVLNVFLRLREVLQQAQTRREQHNTPFPSTRLHDLACFVAHRLLQGKSPANILTLSSSPLTECIRFATVLYILIVQGPTYYPHAALLGNLVSHLIKSLECLWSAPTVIQLPPQQDPPPSNRLGLVATSLSQDTAEQGRIQIPLPYIYSSLDIWILSVGMVAAATSSTPSHYQWFLASPTAQEAAAFLGIGNGCDALVHVKRVLWLETTYGQGGEMFRQCWDGMLTGLGMLP